MTKYNYFTEKEFYAHLSNQEIRNVVNSPTLMAHRDELWARLNIIRQNLGLPITITSWYRDQQHNKREGGSPTSQHLDGSAVDIKCNQNLKLLAVITRLQTEGMDFGQIITYGGTTHIRFIHISLPTRGALNQHLNYA